MAKANELTKSEQDLFRLLRSQNGESSIAEIATLSSKTKNSLQVSLSNLRRKCAANGYAICEPRKLARGGGGNSVDIDSFMESVSDDES